MTSPAIARLQAALVTELESICAVGAAKLAVEMLGKLAPKVPAWPRTREDVAAFNGTLKVARRKAPIQLCPSPGCKERAAPCFGMLCAAHKDADKATVRAWREQRRARRGR